MTQLNHAALLPRHEPFMLSCYSDDDIGCCIEDDVKRNNYILEGRRANNQTRNERRRRDWRSREVVRRLSGARSSELFIPRAMREKDESRKATCEAVVTLASEIGNCPTNGITNACALAPDGK
ncbi:hypothetical protein ALC56_04723 [Trachymyrmex septentrionalis]|uniref:Uncharacterized protein n=1 Tax=Trachymyrmex septentrionalis TaxID=34720 RepID=A0A195FKP6_9HYME|nr:hypothetical protein ALC56_04723 [Trachymyrmex septentrionalis]